jgi:hypothetical protein
VTRGGGGRQGRECTRRSASALSSSSSRTNHLELSQPPPPSNLRPSTPSALHLLSNPPALAREATLRTCTSSRPPSESVVLAHRPVGEVLCLLARFWPSSSPLTLHTAGELILNGMIPPHPRLIHGTLTGSCRSYGRRLLRCDK